MICWHDFRHERENHPDSESTAAVATEEPESQDKEDRRNNYHSARLGYGLLITLLDDAVKEGDAG